jgi:hypothetical protein
VFALSPNTGSMKGRIRNNSRPGPLYLHARLLQRFPSLFLLLSSSNRLCTRLGFNTKRISYLPLTLTDILLKKNIFNFENDVCA